MGTQNAMTLDEAVAVLNEKRHRGGCDWYAYIRGSNGSSWVHGIHDDIELTSFEAIAVAKAYREMDLEAKADSVTEPH